MKPRIIHKTVKVTMPMDLLFTVCNTRQPNQTFDNRVAELVKKGLATDDENR